MRRFAFYIWVCLAVFANAVSPLAAEPAKTPLTFLYLGSPPYIFSINGKMDGIFIESVQKVMHAAGFEPAWIKVAANRGLRMMEEGVQPFCLVTQGSFHRKGDGDLWNISDPIGQVENSGLLIRAKESQKISRIPTITELVENSSYRGGFLRAALEREQGEETYHVDPLKHLIVNTNPFELGQLVARGRIDFIIASKKAVLVHKSFYDDIEELAFIKMDGIIQKERLLNILCSKAVPIDVMLKINAGIKAVKAPVPH